MWGALAQSRGGAARHTRFCSTLSPRAHVMLRHSQPGAALRIAAKSGISAARHRRCMATMTADIAGRALTLEVGKVGPLADAVVFAKYGETSLLVSAVSGWELSSSDFLPLQVDFREKAFAGGIIPSTFTRREASASDRETLAARVIDRTLRPLFPKGFYYDTQLICSIMSFDKDCDPSMLSIIAASAALHVSNIPWNGPCAAVRVGWVDGKPVLAPTYEQDVKSKLNLLYAGIEDKTLMMELGAFELPEAKVIEAMRFAHDQLQPLIELQKDFRAMVGKPKKDLPLAKVPDEVLVAVKELIWEDARTMYRQHHFKKAERGNAQRLLFIKIHEHLRPKFAPEFHRYLSGAGDTVMKAALRSLVDEAAGNSPPQYINPILGPAENPPTPHLAVGDALAVERNLAEVPAEPRVECLSGPPLEVLDDDDNKAEFQQFLASSCRPDGRSTTDIRNLKCEVDVLPLVHGSSIFSRGDTQVLCTTTLGPLDLAQTLRPLSGDIQKKNFFLHYDFPPYCTNEVGKVGGANRRMVGHGALAEKALVPVMPDENEFPYTIRATSEVTGSDGSSSMATVCGAMLSLLDAGVPVKTAVAGISIGAFCPPAEHFRVDGQNSRYFLLTDIFGLEDHSGDMDFKVAGSRYGVTALQLDVKPAGLPLEVLEQGLWRARIARMKVLDTMASVLPRPRTEMKPSAPRIEQMVIPQELVGKLIGPGGSNVKKIMSATGARVQIDSDSPTISVYANVEGIANARNMIHATIDEHRRMIGSPLSLVTSPSAPILTVGTAVTCKVLKVHDFGVVLGTDSHEVGWMHISEFAPKRTTKVTDVMDEGDEVTAMVVDVDVRGRGKFSIRSLLGENETDPYRFIKRAKSTSSSQAPSASVTEPVAVPGTIPATPLIPQEQPLAPAEKRPSPSREEKKVNTIVSVIAAPVKQAVAVWPLTVAELIRSDSGFPRSFEDVLDPDYPYAYLETGAKQGLHRFISTTYDVRERCGPLPTSHPVRSNASPTRSHQSHQHHRTRQHSRNWQKPAPQNLK